MKLSLECRDKVKRCGVVGFHGGDFRMVTHSAKMLSTAFGLVDTA